VRLLSFILLILFTITPALAADDRGRALKVADQKLKKLVDDAIDRGSEWLAGTQAENGSFGAEFGHPLGGTAISVLALLHSGMAPDHQGVKKAFKFMRRQHRSSGSSHHTYSA